MICKFTILVYSETLYFRNFKIDSEIEITHEGLQVIFLVVLRLVVIVPAIYPYFAELLWVPQSVWSNAEKDLINSLEIDDLINK